MLHCTVPPACPVLHTQSTANAVGAIIVAINAAFIASLVVISYK